MNLFAQHRLLSTALGISLLVHGLLLAVHFAAPDAFRFKPSDPELEVILVNAKHDKKPVNAQALAQANLDGGGNAEDGRAKSPLPDMQRVESGDSVKAAQRKVVELEQQQRKMLAQLQAAQQHVTSADQVKPVEAPQPSAHDMTETAKAMARMEAEVAKNIEQYNKRPRKTQITPSTREVGYAQYYKTLQDKIEKVGTLNFPTRDGKKLYGELLIVIPVFQDGTIYERDGGVVVRSSSGNAALDQAAVAIVRRSAPFGRFPDNMRTSGKDDVWEIITRFRFTRDQGLQAELGAG
ncbi:TonB C-terminal domain-containing protein [Herbaspirillum sp. AP02]|uniref:TonB C-terminal domain-containing protein n=1 Tax=unclassified Herbaspirillum TaxID=2624150 RepID=UPI0015D9F25E|nr:TonB C-terminal domain-containing protein [Herbaspirillum sp. AP02]NZD67728.1 TonB C-terminal domain-containing protein [Herbaspirillum sp. AP21]